MEQNKNGCGCQGNANAQIASVEKVPLTEKQQKLLDRIRRTNYGSTSIYNKTNKIIFM